MKIQHYLRLPLFAPDGGSSAPPDAAPFEGTAAPPPSPAAPAAPNFATDIDAHSKDVDPDEIALAEFRREAGQAPREEAAPVAPDPQAPPAPAAPPQQGKGAARQHQPMIPKARLDEVLESNRQLRERAIYLEGVAAARAAGAAPAAPGAVEGGPQAPPPPSAADKLKEIHGKIDQLAADYDDGKMSMRELEQKRRELANEEQTLREREIEERLAKKMPAQQGNQPGLADQILIEETTARLEQQHPYVLAMSEQHLGALTEMARAEAAANGQAYGKSDAETIRLRTHVAQLSDIYGPRWGLQVQAAEGGAPARPMSPQAAARAAKIGLAGRHAPDTSQIGQGGGQRTPEAVKDSNILAMSDFDLESLPASTRAAYLS